MHEVAQSEIETLVTPETGVTLAIGAGLAQRRPVEGDAIGVVDEPVADGVGDSRITERFVPSFRRHL